MRVFFERWRKEVNQGSSFGAKEINAVVFRKKKDSQKLNNNKNKQNEKKTVLVE